MIVGALALMGAVGAVARYLVDGLVQARARQPWPVGILVVNATGCALAGVLVGAADAGLLDPDLRVALVAGFCGSYTTMSSFAYETVALARGDERSAVAYLVASVAAGLAAAGLGLWLGTAAS